jgi:biopolymer transport protein ExbD
MVGTTIHKQEADISFMLPGVAETNEAIDFPDEQIIEIRADGQVIVNDYAYDTPGAERLTQLAGMLARFRQASEASKSTVAVTIAPDPAVPHQRIVRVMDACAQAGITQVNFALGDEGD